MSRQMFTRTIYYVQSIMVCLHCTIPIPTPIPIICRKVILGQILMVILIQSYHENYFKKHLISTNISGVVLQFCEKKISEIKHFLKNKALFRIFINFIFIFQNFLLNHLYYMLFFKYLLPTWHSAPSQVNQEAKLVHLNSPPQKFAKQL